MHWENKLMNIKRRDLITAGAPLIIGAGLISRPVAAQPGEGGEAFVDLKGVGLAPNSDQDQTSVLQKLIDRAAKQGRRLMLPRGHYITGPLQLPSVVRIEGAGPGTRLIFKGAGGLSATKATDIFLYQLTFDGAGQTLDDNQGLLTFENCNGIVIEHCRVEASRGHGMKFISSAGRVLQNNIKACVAAGLFALDSQGLEISGNHISDCENNGVLVWRGEKGPDGTIVTNNRIERIKAQAGGTGQNGNGINVFRAGDVLVANNTISDCSFSAVRNNGGDNVQILNNHCRKLGEVALYSEFAFEGAVISNNLVDDAHVGISITNFNEGGRLATATGNLIRRVKARKGVEGIGIAIEADTLASGNVIEAVDGVGLSIGFQQYMRDVTANNNLIRGAKIGIGVTTYKDAGYAMITGNMITGASKGGIRAMDQDKPFGPDLSKSSPEAFLNLAVYGNVSL